MQLRQHRVKTALRCLDCYQQGFLFLDLAHPDSWLILYASPEAVEQTGKAAASSLITKHLASAVKTQEGGSGEGWLLKPLKQAKWSQIQDAVPDALCGAQDSQRECWTVLHSGLCSSVSRMIR